MQEKLTPEDLRRASFGCLCFGISEREGGGSGNLQEATLRPWAWGFPQRLAADPAAVWALVLGGTTS